MIRMSSDSVRLNGSTSHTVGVLWIPGRTNPSLVIHNEGSCDVLAHFKSPEHARTFAHVLGLTLSERQS